MHTSTLRVLALLAALPLPVAIVGCIEPDAAPSAPGTPVVRETTAGREVEVAVGPATLRFVEEHDVVYVVEDVPLDAASVVGELTATAGGPLTALELFRAVTDGEVAPTPAMERAHVEQV